MSWRYKGSFGSSKELTDHYCKPSNYCGECNIHYTSGSSYKRHIKESHRGEKNFKCDICCVKFAQKMQRDGGEAIYL